MREFKPLYDRVVIRPASSDQRSAGGILIPDNAQEKPQEGEIVAVGSGVRNEAGNIFPLEVRMGDRVLFGKWTGTEIKIRGETYLVMKESDVIGILR